MKPDDKIIEKLKKIKAHMESAKAIGSEEEAQTFAAMLQNLLLKHKLEMTELETEESEREPIIEESIPTERVWDGKKWKTHYKGFPDVEVRKKRVLWITKLGRAVASYHSCQITCDHNTSKVWFVGTRSNVEVSQYLFVVLHRAAESLAIKAYFAHYAELKKEGRGEEIAGYAQSFLEGFVDRVLVRFEEELNKFKKEVDTTGTALVRINKEALAVKDYLKDREKLWGLSGKGSHHSKGYNDGTEAANNMNLTGKAVNAGNPKGKKELR